MTDYRCGVCLGHLVPNNDPDGTYRCLRCWDCDDEDDESDKEECAAE